jgi:hypothetical protein
MHQTSRFADAFGFVDSRDCETTGPPFLETIMNRAFWANFRCRPLMRRLVRTPKQHFRLRRPGGPNGLTTDLRDLLPGKSLSTDANAVFTGYGVSKREMAGHHKYIESASSPSDFLAPIASMTPSTRRPCDGREPDPDRRRRGARAPTR